jgi:chromosomal replication initiation ATPase DnaA
MPGSYLAPELVSEGRSALLSGPSATGKTHLCIAIAYQPMKHGYEALFVSADTLISRLSHAAVKGRLESTLEPFLHPHLLVIDELRYLLTHDGCSERALSRGERTLLETPSYAADDEQAAGGARRCAP